MYGNVDSSTSSSHLTYDMRNENASWRIYRKNHEKIVASGLAFAKTLAPWSETMDDESLRDHANELLTAVLKDIKSPQSDQEQCDKSEGRRDDGELARIGQNPCIGST